MCSADVMVNCCWNSRISAVCDCFDQIVPQAEMSCSVKAVMSSEEHERAQWNLDFVYMKTF